MWTLLAADRPDLPFGIRTASHDFGGLKLRHGDRVGVRAGFVGIRSGSTCHVVDCRSAQRWQPVSPGQVRTRRRQSACPRCEPPRPIVPGTAQHRWRTPSGARSMCRMLCARVLGRVVGHGPGSTPSGDDVLVGIFAVLTASRSGAAGAAAARSLDELMRPLSARNDRHQHATAAAGQPRSGRSRRARVDLRHLWRNRRPRAACCHPTCCRNGRDVGCGYLHGIAGFCTVILPV